MIVKTFVGLDKRKAMRRALDYWYKNFRDDLTLIQFCSKCVWRKKEQDYYVIYRGPAPKDKK